MTVRWLLARLCLVAAVSAALASAGCGGAGTSHSPSVSNTVAPSFSVTVNGTPYTQASPGATIATIEGAGPGTPGTLQTTIYLGNGGQQITVAGVGTIVLTTLISAGTLPQTFNFTSQDFDPVEYLNDVDEVYGSPNGDTNTVTITGFGVDSSGQHYVTGNFATTQFPVSGPGTVNLVAPVNVSGSFTSIVSVVP